MSNAYRELARGIKNMAKKQSNSAVNGLYPELGTITSTGLLLDRFKYEFNEFLIAEYLSFPDIFASTAAAGSDLHSHDVLTPDQLKSLQAGDRVLAIPVNDGQDYVVIARVIANG